MATFAGEFIFGYQVVCVTSGTTRVAQTNEFFGIGGVEELDGGFRGHTTVVRGRLVGWKAAGGLADLMFSIESFRRLLDGNSYVLVDSYGQAWANVKMLSFDMDPMIQNSPQQWWVSYSAVFKHLSEQ